MYFKSDFDFLHQRPLFLLFPFPAWHWDLAKLHLSSRSGKSNVYYEWDKVLRWWPGGEVWWETFKMEKKEKDKLAKLRRHASRVHFASNSFGPMHFVLEHFRLDILPFLSATLSASLSTSMSATTMSSRRIVRAQRRWQNGNTKVWRTYLRTDWPG